MSMIHAMAEIDMEIQRYRKLIDMVEANSKAIRADNTALKRLVTIKKKYEDLVSEQNELIGEYYTLQEMVNN
jgi:predicted  nucleic acid-binding Zn-ribbon protein